MESPRVFAVWLQRRPNRWRRVVGAKLGQQLDGRVVGTVQGLARVAQQIAQRGAPRVVIEQDEGGEVGCHAFSARSDVSVTTLATLAFG